MAQEPLDLGNGMKIVVLTVDDLREQETNAHVMSPSTFERLVDNIRRRGRLESLPYAAQPNSEGPFEIVSGHHRVRAARAAGLTEIPVLLDTAALTRSQIVAKQLAHNALVGSDDPEIIKQLLATIDDPEDLLTTGLPEDMMPSLEKQGFDLFMPRVSFDWRTVSFTVLPHQQAEIEELCERLEDRHDLVLATMADELDAFIKAAAGYARLKDIRSGGSVVAALTEYALAQLREVEEPDGQQNGRGAWVKLSRIFGDRGMPAEAAEVVELALEQMRQRGEITEKNAWRAIELWAADYLSGAKEAT